jgi:hypothetical protein
MSLGYNNKLHFGVDLADGWSITSSQNTLKEIFCGPPFCLAKLISTFFPSIDLYET